MGRRRPEVKQATATPAIIVETGEGRIITTPLDSPINDQAICIEFHAMLPTIEGRDGDVKYQSLLDFHLLTKEETRAPMEALQMALR